MTRLALLGLTTSLLMAGPTAVRAQNASDRPDCTEWHACLDQALDAAARGDYETFHDLAWRAVQTGPPQSVDLMYLLARAQSLSGRPDDALVMLRRITERGTAPVDALTSDDFARARALAGWPQVKTAIEGVGAGSMDAPALAPSGALVSATATATVTAAAPPPPTPTPRVEAGANPPAVGAAVLGGAPAVSAVPVAPPAARIDEALRFASSGLVPSGLAFDAVSGRFLFGAGSGRKVIVVGEGSARPVDLVRQESGAFYDIQALVIDARRGDLWVASGDGRDADGPGADTHAALHKLQLISGRPLSRVAVPADARGVRFSDLAVTAAGAVLVLDTEGRRIWRLAPGGHDLLVASALSLDDPVSLAMTDDDGVGFVAHRTGVSRVALATGRAELLQAPADVRLDGIERLRWHEGSLIAVQRVAGSATRVTRLRLARGGLRVMGVDVLDPSVPDASTPPAVALSGGDFYYTTTDIEPAGAPGQATVVRRARVP